MPTTTSPSRSGWTSSSPGSGRSSGEACHADDAPVIETAHFTIDLVAKRATAGGVDVHLTPKEWQLVELLVRNPGKLVSQRQVLQEVWGPQYETETDYLRVFIAAVRRKLEPEPGRPRYFITEPGMGYRFEPDAT